MCAGAVVALVSCGGNNNIPHSSGDEYEARLFPGTHVLDVETMKALTQVDADGTLHFAGTPHALKGIQPPEVVLGGVSSASPGGFLRYVTSTGSDAGGLVLHTAQAPIQMAFQKLHVKFSRHIVDLGAPDVAWNWQTQRVLASNSKWQSKHIDFFAMNGDGDPATTDDQVHVVGDLSGGFDYTFGVDVDWGDVFDLPSAIKDCAKSLFTSCSVQDLLPEATVGYSVSAGADAKLHMQGVTFLPYEAPYTLGKATLEPLQIGPLWFFPVVEVKATISGSATSQFSFDVGAHASAGMGVTFSSKSGANVEPPHADFDFDAANVDATLQAGGRVDVGPELHLRLFKVAGPYAGLFAFAELSAEQNRTPCYELHAGVSSEFGFDIQSPKLPLLGNVTLADWSKKYDLSNKLADSGACKPLPGGSGPSPTGGAPDPAAFANPAFTPWSRTYSGAVSNHPYLGPGGQIAWLDATPSIDGRFVLAGSATKALVKIDPDGKLVWSRRYLGPVSFYNDTLTPELLVSNLQALPDGTMLAVAHPYTLMKLEADGSVLWAEQFDVAYRDSTMRLTSVAPAADGGVFVGGTFGENRIYAQKVDAWLMRLDAHGKVVWSKRWGNAEDGETLRTLLPWQGGVVVGGATWAPANSRWRAWTTRFDGDGKLLWSKTYDSRKCGSAYEASAFVTSGVIARDGDAVFGGTIEDSHDYTLVFKLKPDGTLAWSTSGGSSRDVDTGTSVARIVELPSSGYLLSGTLGYSENGTYSDAQQDLFLAGTDSVGQMLWLERYGGSRIEANVPRRSDAWAGATLTRDGGVLLVGYTDTLTPAGNGLWAAKMPAKSGSIAFNASTTAVSGAIGFADPGYCLTGSDWDQTPSDYDAQPKPLVVKVEPASVDSYVQAP